ncbi:hypothetical protein [Paenibacillus jilunlii]|uniref:Uncharacterized protein n=1 Tax=Paenibacillus jilunlii TaxID=682956 RepID=A0A1G9SXX4_9BACL|nr:hypothetical protein [Paenibacillus jilunlii]KWX75063.1 hypothetical protein AML91_13430 [Paenibacillus jilunlii]SDM40266.1 hypothetical protein SAMN05216191_112114 [Paenibacillus jilunlii]
MQASFQPTFTWSQERIFAAGAQNVVLLIEWKGISNPEESRKRTRKVVAREIELRIWLEAHVTFNGCHGCNAETGEGRSILLKLGKLYSKARKYIALEFTMAAKPAGIHEALWLQWQYKQPPVERIRELPLKKLSMEYTHHTDVLSERCCFHVEKHLVLLKTEKLLEEVAVQRTKGNTQTEFEHLRRQADDLLLLAARSGDMQLVKEAETVYKQLDAESQVWWRTATR